MPLFLITMLGQLNWRDWLFAGLVVVAISGGLYARSYYIALGRNEALQDIEAANEKAQSNANTGTKDVRACYDGGGTWNRINGVCDSPATGK